MICKTCGKNEAINDYYEECQGCIMIYAKKISDSLLKPIDDDISFWERFFIGFVLSIPIMYIILLFIWSV